MAETAAVGRRINQKLKPHFMKRISTIDIVVRVAAVLIILGVLYTAYLRYIRGPFF